MLPLTQHLLCEEAAIFAKMESSCQEPSLYGASDGKRVGTYFEHKFIAHLQKKYTFEQGNSARGIDFPDLHVDIKVTSIRQPQSSCPFRSAWQKIYGLGYSLLVFVYDKMDDHQQQVSRLHILHAIYVEAAHTADYQTTTGLLKILENNGNRDDILAFFEERLLPVDSMEAEKLAEEILRRPPLPGYLTISNALQWRLQYNRIIEQANLVQGVIRVYQS